MRKEKFSANRVHRGLNSFQFQHTSFRHGSRTSATRGEPYPRKILAFCFPKLLLRAGMDIEDKDEDPTLNKNLMYRQFEYI